MAPVLDICHVVGDSWTYAGHSGNFAAWEPYLKAMVAAGWEYVANETGSAEWSGSGTGSNSWLDFCVNVCGFKGVINYNGGGTGWTLIIPFSTTLNIITLTPRPRTQI
jgi:hypothetical protein